MTQSVASRKGFIRQKAEDLMMNALAEVARRTFATLGLRIAEPS